MTERKLRIEIRSGRQRKEITFPVPEELERHLLDLLKVEDAMTGLRHRVASVKRHPWLCSGYHSSPPFISLIDILNKLQPSAAIRPKQVT